MRVAAIICLAVIAAPAVASKTEGPWTENPEHYWNRGYGSPDSSESYHIVLGTGNKESLDSLNDKVGAILSGGGEERMGENRGARSYSGNSSRQQIQISYRFKTDEAEKVAKKLLLLGELFSYQLNKRGSRDNQLNEIEERIGILQKELSENKAALARMPAASYFLNAKLKPLLQARDAYKNSQEKSVIHVTVQEGGR